MGGTRRDDKKKPVLEVMSAQQRNRKQVVTKASELLPAAWQSEYSDKISKGAYVLKRRPQNNAKPWETTYGAAYGRGPLKRRPQNNHEPWETTYGAAFSKGVYVPLKRR